MATLVETYQTSPAQPGISYVPNPEQYARRTQHRMETESLHLVGLPTGFPQKLVSKMVWEGQDVTRDHDFVYTLSDAQVTEIESALGHFKTLKKPLGYINQETFPLPTLHAILRGVSQEVHFGRGFKVLRGLPVWKHEREDNIIMYTGVSSHVAPIRGRQDKQFEGKPADVILNHIKDLSTTTDKDRIGSPAFTADPQGFHTDTGDIVSILALSLAAEGGQSKLSSSWRVYNELAETRPDLIATLAGDWYPENFRNPDRPYDKIPLLHHLPACDENEERIAMQYVRWAFTGYQGLSRSPSLPPITEAQAEALDAVHFLAQRFHVGLDIYQGDIQYVNNLSMFHGRDGFKDTRDQQRHLLRLWLRDPEYAWPTPDAWTERWNRLYDGIKPENEVFPLEPRLRTSTTGVSKVQGG